MERWIRNDEEFQRLFNCSFYNVSDIPLDRRENVLYGLFLIIVSIVEIVCDIFDIVSFFSNRKLKQ
jgi:hypothetical protein